MTDLRLDLFARPLNETLTAMDAGAQSLLEQTREAKAKGRRL